MRLIVILVLALLNVACGPALKPTIERAKAQLSDPAEVVARTCAPAASSLCGCIVSETVKTLQAGPREIIAVFEEPEAVWGDVLSVLDPKQRARVENEKAAAEASCRARLTVHRRSGVIAGEDGSGRSNRPRQTLRSSCAAANASPEACACYERTLKATLSAEAYAAVRADAAFPPVFLNLPESELATVRATMAAARSACGIATPSR